MFRTLLISFTFSLGLICLAGCDPEIEVQLRVLTFNIHHGETLAGEIDLEAMAAVIQSAKPDLVALQEVDVHTSRVEGISLVEKLAEICGMNSYFARALDFGGGEYGNAVLSRFPIVETHAWKLPSSEGHEPRVAADCLIAIPSDTIRFISTHFDHVSENPDRPAQAKALLDIFQKDEIPSILAGDLNDTPDSETLQILKQYWTISGGEHAFTSPADMPVRKIDYLLYAPKGQWKVINSRVLPDKVSDHLAVLTVFRKLSR